MTHLEKILAALYVSEGWWENFQLYFGTKSCHNKQWGLYSKARAVIVYDRILNGEDARTREVIFGIQDETASTV